MDEIQKVLVKAGRKDLAKKYYKKITSKRRVTAKLGDGPIGKVLDKYWNKFHDFEYELEQAMHSYYTAESYPGKGKKMAKDVIAQTEKVLKEIKNVSMKSLGKLFEAEDKFTKKFKHPDDYSLKERERIFPN